MKTNKPNKEQIELIEQGEKIMQELWMELGYRVAEEDEGYIVLAKWYNKTWQKAQDEARKEIEDWKLVLNQHDNLRRQAESKLIDVNRELEKIRHQRKTNEDKLIRQIRREFKGIRYIGTCSTCGSDSAIFEVGNKKECLVCYMSFQENKIANLESQINPEEKT
jgi:hypothetical protein